jgi:hypothetical protein
MTRSQQVLRSAAMNQRTLRAVAAALDAIRKALLLEARTLPRPSSPRPSRRRPRLSTERRRQLMRQGEYIGSMRGLPVRKKAQVKREREVRGIAAAIQLAKKLAKA